MRRFKKWTVAATAFILAAAMGSFAQAQHRIYGLDNFSSIDIQSCSYTMNADTPTYRSYTVQGPTCGPIAGTWLVLYATAYKPFDASNSLQNQVQAMVVPISRIVLNGYSRMGSSANVAVAGKDVDNQLHCSRTMCDILTSYQDAEVSTRNTLVWIEAALNNGRIEYVIQAATSDLRGSTMQDAAIHGATSIMESLQTTEDNQ